MWIDLQYFDKVSVDIHNSEHIFLNASDCISFKVYLTSKRKCVKMVRNYQMGQKSGIAVKNWVLKVKPVLECI